MGQLKRNTSPEHRDWWKAVDEAAKNAPKLVEKRMKEKKGHATGRLQGVIALSQALENELRAIVREDELCDKADALVREALLKVANLSIDCLAAAQAWQITTDRERSKGNG